MPRAKLFINYIYRLVAFIYRKWGFDMVNERSILKGKREEITLNKHKVTVIAPDKLIDYEKGRERLRKLLIENK